VIEDQTTLRVTGNPTSNKTRLITRVGQNRINAPYMTVYLAMSPPKVPCIHRIYVVLANPTYYAPVPKATPG